MIFTKKSVPLYIGNNLKVFAHITPPGSVPGPGYFRAPGALLPCPGPGSASRPGGGWQICTLWEITPPPPPKTKKAPRTPIEPAPDPLVTYMRQPRHRTYRSGIAPCPGLLRSHQTDSGMETQRTGRDHMHCGYARMRVHSTMWKCISRSGNVRIFPESILGKAN